MKFALNKTIEIIQNTPGVLHALLQGLSDDWIYANEGANTWSAFDVVGHLIVCEQTDFIPRTEIILSDANNKTFAPIDMNAQFELHQGKTITELLATFAQLRKENIQQLLALQLGSDDFQKTGIHPKVGQLTLSELLATWVVHDLNHISQIVRVIAKQYKNEVGPFIEFVNILNK